MKNTFHCLTLLLASTTIILVQTTLGYPFTCPVEPIAPHCSCQETASLIQFQCPKSNPTLYVDVQDQKRTDLKCIGSEPYDFKSVRNLGIGNASLLRVVNCVLDKDQPVLKTFEFLEVTNVRYLLYDNNNQGVQYNARYFEQLEQLENLTLSRGVLGFDEDTFTGTRNLKRLTIEKNNLELQSGTFEVLRNLTYLDLESNQINELELGLFTGLENLEALSLSFNEIKSLGNRTFTGLKSLRKLNLRANSIESIDAGAFSALPKLTDLVLSFNPFYSLPEGLFAENMKLETLDLACNEKLAALPEELLANLPKLSVIDLSHNAIRHIPETLLSRSSDIIEINLRNNNLDRLPEKLLNDQRRLQVLNLDKNQLELIPEHIFKYNSQLRTLHLSNNYLTSLPENIFAYLMHLKELHLENNKLQTLAQFIFIGTGKLEEIYMQNNQLTWHAHSFKNVKQSTAENDNTPFQYMEKLHVLKLSNNNITTIFADWYMNNLELQDLDLSNNQITELSYINLQFRSNIRLDLSNNTISKIVLNDLKIPPNQKIKVDLSNNPLNCDCDALKLVQLVQSPAKTDQFVTQNLHCAQPQNLRNKSVDRLETKFLVCDFESGCPTVCQCAKRPLDHTIVVNCSGRGLTQIPELPKPSVEQDYNELELRIENNRLTELPLLDQPGYNEVTLLYAQNNSIRELLPQNIPARLRFMDLSQNQLQMIGDSSLKILNRSTHLETLHLSQNQWRCDCPASRFLIFVQQNSRLIPDMSGVLCNPSGKSLDSITVNELCFEDYTLIFVLCFVVAILGVLIALISVLFFRYKTEVKVWLFTHNLFLSLITEEELDKDKLYDAFISYSHLDEDFITDELIPKLENEPMNFKTCWHVRDFMPGEMIMTQIVKSIEASRRTVIVLSKNFLESSWAKHEFRQAHVQSMEDNRVRVIVVIYEDIGDIENLDSELKAYLKTNTYVKWGDPWFWKKLRYAMPHPVNVKGIKSAVSEIHLQQVTTSKVTPTAV